MKKQVLRYSIATGVCAILVFLIVTIRGIFSEGLETYKVFHYLTDAFFVIGVLAAGVGLLLLASNGGAFDFIVYGISRFISLFKKDPNKVRYKTYYDYHIAKAERKKVEFLYLVIIGVVFIALSMLFLYFYYQNGGGDIEQ